MSRSSDELKKQVQQHKRAAAAACDAGDYTASAHEGTLSLQLESDWHCAQAQLNLRVVSFSLFGNDPLYGETAIMNAQAMPTVYPDWQMWVYHDGSVPAHVLARLRHAGARLLDVTQYGIAHWPGTFWRFHALTQPHVAYVQCRDADSLISAREAEWVDAWLTSGKPFHVLRDWYSHIDLMLAGLWGAYAPFAAQMDQWVEDYLQTTPQLHPTHADQMFLAQVVWPRIAPYCLVHDTVHDLSAVSAIDSPRPGTHSSDALGGFKAKHMRITLPPDTQNYLVTLRDQNNQVVMQYQRSGRDGHDEFHLPQQYYEKIESGQWRIDYRPLPTVTVTVGAASTTATMV